MSADDGSAAIPPALRLLEAIVFAAPNPLTLGELAARLPVGTNVRGLLSTLRQQYAGRGIELVEVGDRWRFRTAADLDGALVRPDAQSRKPTRAALETLAIIAYHQPVSRAEIEAVRGVAISKGTLDTLLEAGWVKPGPRRETPGRPLTWVTTSAFLDHFGLAGLAELPGVDELRALGLMDGRRARDRDADPGEA